jgi:hypothetical protein
MYMTSSMPSVKLKMDDRENRYICLIIWTSIFMVYTFSLFHLYLLSSSVKNFKCLLSVLGLDSKLYQLIWNPLLTNYTHELMTAKQNTDNRHLKFLTLEESKYKHFWVIATISISILKLCSLGTISIVMTSTPKYLEKFELL